MERKDVRPREDAGAGAAPALPALAPLFDPDADLAGLERMLLALAVHPEGCGATSAWLLRIDPVHDVLEGWRAATPAPGREPLEAALGRARRAAPGESTEERRLRAWAEPPARLEGALSASWRGAGATAGAGGEQPGAPWSGAPRVAFVRLERTGAAYGVLVVEPAAGEADERALARLDALRALAEGALAVAAQGAERRARARQAAALAEFAASAGGSMNVAEALHQLARLATSGLAARGAAVYLAAEDGTVRVEVAHGPAAVRERLAQGWLAAAGEAIETGQALSGARGEDGPHVPADVAGETSAWVVQPVVAYERRLGAVAVYDGPDRREPVAGFEAHDLGYLAALAALAGLLLAHANALGDMRRTGERHREQAARLRELDRLAGVGELASRVAQEARNPLASITAFARRAQRELAGDDARTEYLEIVVREAARLEAMLAEQQQYAQLERPRLRVQSLNAVVQEALLRSSETLVRRRVRLMKKLAPDVPSLLLDAPRIQRVVENVVAWALECVSAGGRIQVESRRAGDYALVEIAFDGQRQGGDLLDHLFVPFATGPAAGAAVGLGLAQQIVREHGGEVRVRGETEWSTIFSFTLPIAGNEDRRRNPERRSVRRDRRRREGDPGTGAV